MKKYNHHSSNNASVKKIKFKDAIKKINPFDRDEFEAQYGHMKKIPEYIIREWV